MAALARERYHVGMNSAVVMAAPLNDVVKTSNPTVGTSAALLLTTQLPGRFLIVILNSSNNRTIYISEASYVAISGAGRGMPIEPGQEKAFSYGEDIILFAIADTSSALTNVVEAAG